MPLLCLDCFNFEHIFARQCSDTFFRMVGSKMTDLSKFARNSGSKNFENQLRIDNKFGAPLLGHGVP